MRRMGRKGSSCRSVCNNGTLDSVEEVHHTIRLTEHHRHVWIGGHF